MAARPLASAPALPRRPADDWLRLIGAGGSMLALVILGASMLLRLATLLGSDGQPISTLPAAMETALRLSHRIAAAGVGVLAACAILLCWSRRLFSSAFGPPVVSLVTATVILALIGPLTPGYRFATITIGNVVGGMALLMAFWWLRELATDVSAGRPRTDRLIRATVFIFLAHVATGAAASAQEMHGMRGLAFAHLGTALLVVMFVGACAWHTRGEIALAGCSGAISVLLVAQAATGLGLMFLVARPLWLSFVHGMLSPLLALALVSLAIRSARIERQPLT
ncbi:MAG: hypothetical protein ABI790_06190 [Betaproteobacteria bacterium]